MLSAYTHFHGNILPLGLRNEICSCHYNTFFFLVESLHLKVISSAHAGRLFISDTNNNVIRYLDLNNQEQPQLLTLELKGVQPPNPKPKSFKRLRKRSSDTQTIVVDGGSFREGNLSLKISLPEEYHFSKVHFTLSWTRWTCRYRLLHVMHSHSYLITRNDPLVAFVPKHMPYTCNCRKLGVSLSSKPSPRVHCLLTRRMDILVQTDSPTFVLGDRLLQLHLVE